jgi:hypothetical protein
MDQPIVKKSFVLLFIIFLGFGFSQTWEQNDLMFNPSGIPSLPFSQPRFADLDADGDFDMILGSLDDAPLYFENTGSLHQPEFIAKDEVLSFLSALDAEVCVCADLDDDGDLDLIAGGYTGLKLYSNEGDMYDPDFENKTGFFESLLVGSNPVPDVADLDDDGDPDLVVGLSESGVIKYYSNTGSPEFPEYLEENSEELFDVGLYAYPALADLDADRDHDLLVGRDGHGFYYYKNTGDSTKSVWQSDNSVFNGLGNSTYWNSPALVDLNGDGKRDLVYGTSSGPINYYENTGTDSDPDWALNTILFGGVLDVGGSSSPFLFDFDYDGDLDLVSGSNLGAIKYYENIGTAFGPAWKSSNSYFSGIDHSIYSKITLGDVNGDSLPDAVVGDLSGNLFFHPNTGAGFSFQSSVLNHISLGGWSAPKLVDMDSDNDLDIVCGNEDGEIRFLVNTGSVDSAAWEEIPGYFDGIDGGSNTAPAVTDLDDDGDQDLLVGDAWGDVYYFRNDDGSWTELPDVMAGVQGGQNTSPAFGDLDGDGDPDLVLGNYDGTFNYYENKAAVFIESDRSDAIPEHYALDQVYPNPFNNTVIFKGSIAQTSLLWLEIYNMLGQKILERSLKREAGKFHFSCTFPSELSSGIYIYLLNIYSTDKTKNYQGKLVFLK